VKKTGCAVTAEEHNIHGGLGDAISHILSQNYPSPVEYVGVADTFGESGTPEQLMKKYGLESVNIVAAAERVIKRKKHELSHS
jgi:transketolase